jgi:hypothetical protein
MHARKLAGGLILLLVALSYEATQAPNTSGNMTYLRVSVTDSKKFDHHAEGRTLPTPGEQGAAKD